MTTIAVVKTAQTYAKDLAERVIWTFLLAAGSVALAGITAVGSLVKGVLARVIGDRNSASTASGV